MYILTALVTLVCTFCITMFFLNSSRTLSAFFIKYTPLAVYETFHLHYLSKEENVSRRNLHVYAIVSFITVAFVCFDDINVTMKDGVSNF